MTIRDKECLRNRKRMPENETKFVGKFIHSCSFSAQKDFLQEAKLLHTASKTSEYIVDIIGIVLKPQVIIMKYHRNGSLDDALLEDFNLFGGGDAGEFNIIQRLKFIQQLCLAVNALQNINMVHRDIALRNLLLSDDRESIVLADFGLARKVNLDNLDQNVTATAVIPRTSPPEAWVKSARMRNFGLKTDVWSVAITMFEIINMRPINDEFSELKILEGTQAVIPKKLLLDDITIGKSFTRQIALWNLMLQCWNVKPEMRPQIWEVEHRVKELLLFPTGCKPKNYYVKWEDDSYDNDIPSG